MRTIEIGASRVTLLKLAENIISTFGTTEGENAVELEAESNDSRLEEMIVRFSNEDMERPEIIDNAVYIEIRRD